MGVGNYAVIRSCPHWRHCLCG